MKTIISFDLDMTLLDHTSFQIPKSALDALAVLRREHIVVLATGRDMDNCYSRPYLELVKPHAVIHMNGTKITVENELIYEHHMNPDLLKRLLNYGMEKGYGIGVTIGDDDYYIHPEKVTEHDKKRWGQSGRNFKDPFKLLDLGVRTLAYLGEPEGAKDIENHFPELKLPLFSSQCGADIVEKTVSKAQGLHRLCSYFNIPVESTYAFGDSMNDYEIICEAGTGIAMGNAIEELKQAADYITAPIWDDGIRKACLHFGLISD